MSKHLVVCCDGTWNTSGQKHPTNVVALHDNLAATNADGREQRRCYHPGVGTKRWERLRGGAFGFGLSRNVRDVYRFVVENYEPGDELFLFGFSRGAFTARSLAGLIRNAGILGPHAADRVDEAYALYRSDEGPDATAALDFRGRYSVSDERPIRFIGVWDTVGALGVPDFGIPGMRWLNRRWAFHDVMLSSRVHVACHAIACDEARSPFAPTLWQPNPTAATARQQVEQVWFAGVHCDVGGGYAETGLADLSLRWMTGRAARAGLGFRARPTVTPDAALDTLHDSRTGLYRLFAPQFRQLGTVDPGHEYLADSVARRAAANPGYGTPSVRGYLDDGGQQSAD